MDVPWRNKATSEATQLPRKSDNMSSWKCPESSELQISVSRRKSLNETSWRQEESPQQTLNYKTKRGTFDSWVNREPLNDLEIHGHCDIPKNAQESINYKSPVVSNNYNSSSSPSKLPDQSFTDGSRRFYGRQNSCGSSVFSNELYGDLPTSFQSGRNGHYVNLTRRDYGELEKIVKDYFNKKFLFEPLEGTWTLPAPCDMFISDKWKVDRLQQLKKELNEVKNKLNDYNLDEWHRHTRQMNKAGDIQWTLRQVVAPEFITQAWCKFYENAMSTNLVRSLVKETSKLNSVHLCEAPGAFITSLNHYLKKNHPGVQWNWAATTLNPYYEGNPLSCMINDDRFILQTLDHWKFGLDFTGDLMDLRNMEQLVRDFQDMGDILLVTADGSIDCQEDPGEQENVVAALHYCESVAALHLLAKGGSFLLKMFTLYEADTVCLVYLLCCAFKFVRIQKPATSKEGNSEVYVVCTGYHGAELMKPSLAVLRDHYKSQISEKAMFPLDSIPRDFLDQIYKCASKFKKYQVDVIESNIQSYNLSKHPGRNFRVKKLRNMVVNHFMELYQMSQLAEEHEVVGSNKLKNTLTLNLDPRVEEGSFNDRKKQTQLAPLQLMKVLQEKLTLMNLSNIFREDCIKWLVFSECMTGFTITTGKPVKTVNSSKFCLGQLLKMRNQVYTLTQDLLQSDRSSLELDKVPEHCRDDPMHCFIKKELSEQFPKSVVKYVNYKTELWASMEGGHNEKAEWNAYCDIMDVVDDLWRGECLILRGYPMLTQFNVGIVYMLCHLFEKVGFVKPTRQDSALIFGDFRKKNLQMGHFLKQVDDKIGELRDQGGEYTVLSVLPINQLCEMMDPSYDVETDSAEEARLLKLQQQRNGQREFYQCVTEMNNLCVQEQVSQIISSILLQHEEQ